MWKASFLVVTLLTLLSNNEESSHDKQEDSVVNFHEKGSSEWAVSNPEGKLRSVSFVCVDLENKNTLDYFTKKIAVFLTPNGPEARAMS